MSRGQAYLAPLLLATGLIVNAYAPSHSHWSVMLRPGVLVLAATVVVTTVLLMTMRRPMVAAAGACLLLLIAYEWRVGLLIALLVGLFLAFRRIVMHRHEAIPSQALLMPVALFLALGVARAIGTGTVTPADVFVPEDELRTRADRGPAPERVPASPRRLPAPGHACDGLRLRQRTVPRGARGARLHGQPTGRCRPLPTPSCPWDRCSSPRSTNFGRSSWMASSALSPGLSLATCDASSW